jgi:aminoglycoside phosphotransferase (APT) family kinase protein
VPEDAPPVIVRLAAEWDTPAARAFCAGVEAAVAAAPAGAVVHRGRNLIVRLRVASQDVAVKRFPVTGLRRLVYRVRASKAVRAFDVAERLLSLGIGTPRPLAALELRRGRELVASFYCCAFVHALAEARELKRPDAADRALRLERLGAFVASLHERGVVHRDLTSGNVLLLADAGAEGGLAFQLVDVNRVRFGRPGTVRGLANLAMLRLRDGGALLAGYCRARGLAVARVAPLYRLLLGVRTVRQTVKERTRPLRRRLGL